MSSVDIRQRYGHILAHFWLDSADRTIGVGWFANRVR
jgi:hypothetical protein